MGVRAIGLFLWIRGGRGIECGREAFMSRADVLLMLALAHRMCSLPSLRHGYRQPVFLVF